MYLCQKNYHLFTTNIHLKKINKLFFSLPVFVHVEEAFHRSEEGRHHFLLREREKHDGQLDAGSAGRAVVA